MIESMQGFGGIASGIDTHRMIQQLLQAAAAPKRRLEAQQAELRQTDEAWAAVASQLSKVRSATDGLTGLSDFDGFVKATSSNESAVGATATGPDASGSLSFTVDQLAESQQSSGGSFASADDLVGTGSLTVTIGSGTDAVSTVVDVADGTTLAELADQVDTEVAGMSAQVVKVADGDHRLLLTGEETGVDQAFTVTVDGLTGFGTGFTTIRAAADATLSVGDLTVTRSSNEIDDLLADVTITLNETTTTAVDVSAGRDTDAAVDAVADWAETLGAAMTELREMSAYDADSDTAGPLQGDATVRRIVSSLRTALSTPVDVDGETILPSSLGVEVDRDGQVQVDREALAQAFTENFDRAAAAFARSGHAIDGNATLDRASAELATGDYAVSIDRAATVARLVGGAAYTPPAAGEPKTFTVRAFGHDSVSVTLDSTHDTVSAAVSKINAALRDAGVDELSAEAAQTGAGEDTIALVHDRYGSSQGFEIEYDETGLFEVAEHRGEDVAGTIAGEAATGMGQLLTAADGSDAEGLRIRHLGSGPENFTFHYDAGVVGTLSQSLDRTEGPTGSVQRARDSIETRIDLYGDRIESFEERLAQREQTLRQQFLTMERAMGELLGMQQRMQQQLAGLA